MTGPVFAWEAVRAARGGKAHVLRWAYAGLLVVQLLFAYADYFPAAGPPGFVYRPPTAAETAAFARGFVDLVLIQQFILVILATPAFVAGAVTDEKSRGTLQHLLAADLTPMEIVLGKLLARSCQVAVLCLAGLPMLAFMGPYAGLTAAFLVAWVAVTVLVVFGVSAASVLASVWTKQTRTAALVAYAVLAGAWFAWAAAPRPWVTPALAWVEGFNPLHALSAAYSADDWGEVWRRLGETALAWGGVGVACTGLAVWRLRPAYVRQLESRRRGRFLPAALTARPDVFGHPLAWKERYIGRRVPQWLGLTVTALAVGVATYSTFLATAQPALFFGGFTTSHTIQILLPTAWTVGIVLTLVVGVRASGTVVGERERQTWDGLLIAPFSTRDLVRGKVRGIIAGARSYLLTAYVALATTASVVMPEVAAVLLPVVATIAGVIAWRLPRGRPWAAAGLAVVTAAFAGPGVLVVTILGLGLTWMTLHFIAAVGVWWSVRARSSWRAMLGTAVSGYLGASVLSCVSVPIGCLATLAFAAATFILEGILGPELNGQLGGARSTWLKYWGALWPAGWVVGVVLAFWWAARTLLIQAEGYLAKNDRATSEYLRLIGFDMPVRVVRVRREPKDLSQTPKMRT